MKWLVRRLLAAAALVVVAGNPPQPVAAGSTVSLEPLERYTDWISTRPAPADLAGKVVLVDVFTFGCENCRNVVPNLRALYREHRGDLAIVGVHTPETPYEAERRNLGPNLAAQGIAWPVAVDGDHKLWDAYGIEYWPTQLIFDRHGALRATVVGDSQDGEVDQTIARLIAER
jgi:thiol-disulfide isomerase/thioredoxin